MEKQVFITFQPEFSEEVIKKEEKSMLKGRTRHFRLSRPSAGRLQFGAGAPKSRLSVKSITGKHHVSGGDLFNTAKMELLKRMEPSVHHSRVQCLIETKMIEAPFTSRIEVLNCDVTCPVKRPDFVVKSSKREQVLEFPCTGVGLKSEDEVEIHNIAGKTIFLTRNLLDIDDSFYTTMIPSQSSALPRGAGKGLMLEPEEYIRIKVIYSPKVLGKNIEYLEFTSNFTTIQYKLTGEAKYPCFTVSPQFALAAMEATPGQIADEIITITNDGDVPVYFKIIESFEKEAYDISIESREIQENVFRRKKMASKSLKKAVLSSQVNDWVSGMLEHCFRDRMYLSPIFIDASELRVNPGRKGSIRICFNPPKDPRDMTIINIGSTSPNKQEEGQTSLGSESPKAFAKSVQLLLGGSEQVASWTILSFLREKKTSQKHAKQNSKTASVKSAPTDPSDWKTSNTTAQSKRSIKFNKKHNRKDGFIEQDRTQGKKLLRNSCTSNDSNKICNSVGYSKLSITNCTTPSSHSEFLSETIISGDRSLQP